MSAVPGESRASDRPASWGRDHLANERTLLAWVRTALAFMAFGMGIAKLGVLLVATTAEHQELANSVPSARASALVGAALIAAGGVVAAAGMVGTWRWSAELSGPAPDRRALVMTAALSVVTSIGLTVYVLT